MDKITWWDRIKTTLRVAGAPADDKTKLALAAAGVAVDEEVPGAAQFMVGISDPDPEKERMAQELAAMRAEQRQGQAEAFAEEQIRANKALPAERPALIAAFAQALADDEAQPATVTFTATDGKEARGNRVDALKALFAARPAHELTKELLQGGGAGDAQALFNKDKTDDQDKPMDAEKKKKLMEATPLGQACLKGAK